MKSFVGYHIVKMITCFIVAICFCLYAVNQGSGLIRFIPLFLGFIFMEVWHWAYNKGATSIVRQVLKLNGSLATKHDDEIKELREAVAKELKKFTDDEMSIHEPSGIVATQMRTVNVFSDSTLQAFDTCRNIQLTRKEE